MAEPRSKNRKEARRAFLRHVAASPLLAAGLALGERRILAAADQERAGDELGDVIASIEDAINVFDFHAVARENLPPAHYGYLATGTDDDTTLRANRQGFKKYQLRMRRLVDVSSIDSSMELLGAKYATPIALAPVGNQQAFHPEAEVGAAKAAQKTSSLMLISNNANSSVEDVIQARGASVWFQLYANEDLALTTAMLRRAERAGCPVVALTVDQQGGSNRETLQRFTRMDSRDCSLCHDRSTPALRRRRKPFYQGLDLSRSASPLGMNWESVRRYKDITGMKFFLKGIVTAEDTELCLENGVDGVIVSNHGGRAEASGRGTIECLEEVVKAAQGRIPVLIDSGFRRGTDVFKAVALGADAVCVGRPYVWGLAAFGAEGAEAALNLIGAELRMVMRQAGTASLDRITSRYVVRS